MSGNKRPFTLELHAISPAANGSLMIIKKSVNAEYV
jgi:hypothetical protein